MGKLTLQMKNHVGVLTINSPPANALSTSLLTDLEKQLDAIENNSSIKAVILKGEGRFFSAGADIKEFTSLQTASDYESLARKGQLLFDRMENFHIPTIAATHGAALAGGLALAMAGPMRILSKDGKIGLPETSFGDMQVCA